MRTVTASTGAADAGESSTTDLTSRARIRNAGASTSSPRQAACRGTPLRATSPPGGRRAIGLTLRATSGLEGRPGKGGRRGAGSSTTSPRRITAAEMPQARTRRAQHCRPSDAAVARMLGGEPAHRQPSASRPPKTLPIALSSHAPGPALAAERRLHRRGGVASWTGQRVDQVVTVMIRQLGRLFLQPLVDQVVDSFPAGERPAAKPELTIAVRTPQD